MKKLFLLVILFCTFSITFAQFNVQNGTKTDQTITILDKTYDVYQTSSNSPYIILHSKKTGNDYPLWIGTETDKTFEGKPLRKTKTGKYFYFKESKNGNPYNKYLKENKI